MQQTIRRCCQLGMTNRFVIAAITTATAAATVMGAHAADAAPSRASHPPVRVIADCVHARHEPSQVIIACGDDGTFFKHLHFSSWTVKQAKGEGQLWVNTDDPDGAAGNYSITKVHVTMDQPKHVDGQLRFSRIVAHYVSKHGAKHIEKLYPPIREA